MNAAKTQEMIDEIYRVLAPGSRYITFSLHSVDEIENKYKSSRYQWQVSTFRIKSSRWNEREHRRRAIAHTMIVCDKPWEDGSFPCAVYPMKIPGTLENEEYYRLKTYTENINFVAAVQSFPVDALRLLFYNAIGKTAFHSKCNGLVTTGAAHSTLKAKSIFQFFNEERSFAVEEFQALLNKDE